MNYNQNVPQHLAQQQPNHIDYMNHLQSSAIQPVSSEEHSLLMGNPQQYQQPMPFEYNLASVPESTCHRGSYWCRAKKHLHMNGDGIYKATLVILIVYIVLSILSLWSTLLSVSALLNIAIAIYGGIAVKKRQTSRVGIFSGILVFKMLSDPASVMLMVFLATSNHHIAPKSSWNMLSTSVFGLAYIAQLALLIRTFIHLNREYKREQSKEFSQTAIPEAATFIQVNERAPDQTAATQQPAIYPHFPHQQLHQQPSIFAFEAQANTMREMGFTDQSLIKSTLEKYNGDVASAVREIVAASQL